MDISTECSQLIRLSCAKIITARNKKGGVNLHKNMLILHLMRKARDTQNKIEAAQRTQIFYEESEMEDSEEENQPPLEFSVTDSDETDNDASEPLAFAAEAIEDDGQTPRPLSPAIDDALSRFADRKRKGDLRPTPPRPKTCRVAAADRAVPTLRALL